MQGGGNSRQVHGDIDSNTIMDTPAYTPDPLPLRGPRAMFLFAFAVGPYARDISVLLALRWREREQDSQLADAPFPRYRGAILAHDQVRAVPYR